MESSVEDIIYPRLGVGVGATGALDEAVVKVGPVEIVWGSFLATVIDFVSIALVIFFGFKLLKLEKQDKKKES